MCNFLEFFSTFFFKEIFITAKRKSLPNYNELIQSINEGNYNVAESQFKFPPWLQTWQQIYLSSKDS